MSLEDVAKRARVSSATVSRVLNNLDVVKSADYIIDFGPEGGLGGGKIVAKGTPEEVAETDGSYTGEYLKKILKRHAKSRTE